MTTVVTDAGAVTLAADVLEHLGVKPGDRVDAVLLPGGRVELRAAVRQRPLAASCGALKRPGQRAVSLQEMQDAIEAGAVDRYGRSSG